MDYLPDKLLIVRHGSRLDETMPAIVFRDVDVGYDTPLTYGGFRQSQALGAQIAHLLLLPGNPDRRRKRIIIHSSPFARCVQTSIGIAAGMAQIVAPTTNSHTGMESTSTASRFASPYPRVMLRLDPWLGEWMTEQYFEHWDAALLRSSELVARARNLLNGTAVAEGIRVEARKAQGAAAPSGSPTQAKTDVLLSSARAQQNANAATYQPPKPNHAVLASDPIPAGYVAHARDHCIDFDETWVGLRDGGSYGETWSAFHSRIGSGLREMLQWYATHHPDPTSLYIDGTSQTGDTQATAEESQGISAAPEKQTRGRHISTIKDTTFQSITTATDVDKRNMVDTFGTLAIGGNDLVHSATDDELILILVTHAGGCNKLIHSLTQQPVLIDFPHSSMSLALKSDKVLDRNSTESLASHYKVILQASTDHLNVAAKFRTIQELATINPQPVRQSRSSSRSNRRTTMTSVPPITTSQPDGLWGQSGATSKGSMSASAARPGSQSGLWSSHALAPVRRATMDHLQSFQDLP